MYLQRALEKLDTDFDDCPLYCHDDELRPVDKCAECPVTEANADFKANCERFVTERVRAKSEGQREQRWSVVSLTRTVEHVASLASAQGETGHGANWTVATARLVNILRHEQYKLRRIDDFNLAQEKKNK